MTPYDASFQGVHILFPKENVMNTLGEYSVSYTHLVSVSFYLLQLLHGGVLGLREDVLDF